MLLIRAASILTLSFVVWSAATPPASAQGTSEIPIGNSLTPVVTEPVTDPGISAARLDPRTVWRDWLTARIARLPGARLAVARRTPAPAARLIGRDVGRPRR
jgi:hypothetical protein